MTNEHLFKIGVLPSEIFIGNNGMTSYKVRGNITCRSKSKYCSLPDGCLFTKLTGEINV